MKTSLMSLFAFAALHKTSYAAMDLPQHKQYGKRISGSKDKNSGRNRVSQKKARIYARQSGKF